MSYPITATVGNEITTFPTIKSKFPHESYRPFQEQILDILDANYENCEYFILEAPPGVGKTAIADAFIASHSHGEVLTKQIRLQDQYITGYGFKKVEGRRHFNCLVEALTCDRGRCLTVNEDEDVCRNCVNSQNCDKTPEIKEQCENDRAIQGEISKAFKCENKPYHPPDDTENYPDDSLFAAESYERGDLYWRKLDDNCEYWQQKIDALNFPKVAHNYMYYLLESNFAGDFGSPEALVCDEAHAIEQVVMDFVSVTISVRELTNVNAPIPNFGDVNSWIMWMGSLSTHFIPQRLEILQSHFNPDEQADHRKKLEITRLKRLQEKIKYFLLKYKINPKIWLFLPHQDYNRQFEKVEFRPIYVNDFVKDKLFQNSKKKLLMSATILDFDTFKRSIGITNEKCVTIQVPSPFPVENRLIYKVNIGRLDAKAINPLNQDNSLDKLMAFIDQTVEHPRFRNEKGIIHTTTYKLANYIKENSVYAPRMLFHTDSAGANKVLEDHRDTNEPTIIVSPSMTDGISLDDNLARFQLPLRVPYPNVGDPVIKARANVDRPWYYLNTATTLFQSFGRPVRNVKDYATTIMPDSRLSYFLGKQFGYKNVPRWTMDSLRGADDLEKNIGLVYDFGDNE